MNNKSKNVSNKSKMYSKRPNSVRENVEKRVSLLGLVRYSFNSVNSQKNIGFNPRYTLIISTSKQNNLNKTQKQLQHRL